MITKVQAPILGLLLGAAMLAPSGVMAQQAAGQPVAPAADNAAARRAIDTRMSEDGFRAARDIRMARVAIFQGDTAGASRMVDAARQALDAAVMDGQKNFREVRPRGQTGAVADTMLWIPIDGRLTVADDFVPTPEKQRHIAAANGHLAKGDHAKAMEALRLAEVDVGLSRVLMPLGATRARVESAGDLLRQGRYYEANLALKAAEDVLVVDTEILVARPTVAPTKN